MDVIKSAVTNVWSFADLSSIWVFTYSIAEHASHMRLIESASRWRQEDFLCHLDKHELVMFRPQDAAELEEQQVQELGLNITRKDTLDHYDQEQDGVDILKKLGIAVAASISPKLFADQQMIAFGSMRWIHGSSDFQWSGSTMLRLHVQRSTPDALFFAVTTQSSDLSPWNDSYVQHSDPVYIAPSAALARAADELSPAAKQRQVKPSKQSRAEGFSEAWQAAVRTAVRAYGIDLQPDCGWIQLCVDGDQDRLIWWPSNLCFVLQQSADSPTPPSLIDDATISPVDQILDPTDSLSFAEAWLCSADDRKLELEQSQQQQEMLDDSAEDLPFEFATAASPPFSHRQDLVNALGVYPTPPDGMITAANPRTHFTADASSIIAASNDLSMSQPLANDDPTLLDGHDRGPSISSSTGAPFDHSMTDLFGTADAENGTAEVGDDDFDFFDEQDDIVMQDISSPTTAMPQVTSTSPTFTANDNANSESDSVLHNQDTVHPQSLETTIDPNPTETSSPASQQSATNSLATMHSRVDNHKPLSPFDIRERLMPPPIPASVTAQSKQDQQRARTSTFGPLAFNAGYRFRTSHHTQKSVVPPYKSQSSASDGIRRLESHTMEYDGASESSVDDDVVEIPAEVPWRSHKNNRTSADTSGRYTSWEVREDSATPKLDEMAMAESISNIVAAESHSPVPLQHTAHERKYSDIAQDLFVIAEVLQLEPNDVVNIAQILTEQSITCLGRPGVYSTQETGQGDAGYDLDAALTAAVITEISVHLLPLTGCDVTSFAMVKDFSRPGFAPMKGQPRPPPKLEGMQGPDIQSAPAPYLRFRRADAPVELLPPALRFWEELNLGPYGESKNLCLFCVGPSYLKDSTAFVSFMEAFVAAYEGLKLGIADVGDLLPDHNADQTSKRFRSVDKISRHSLQDPLQMYHDSCIKLAQDLTSQPRRSNTVILMVDHALDDSFRPSLCACFHALKKRQGKSVGATRSHHHGQLYLQILPLSMFAQENLVRLVSSEHNAMLAREIYDRCPPASQQQQYPQHQTSPLAIACSPATLLTEPLPKRINLQLVASPPTDLIHENSELHVAYSRSADKTWMTVCWLDSTGSAQQTSSFYLANTNTALSAAVKEIVYRTVELLHARDVSWRVTVVTDGSVDADESRCWYDAVSATTSVNRALTLSFISLEQHPILSFTTTGSVVASRGPVNSGGGFITPVATPQGFSVSFSPDASGQATPSTPVPTDSANETEADAILVDLTDETCRVLLKSDMSLTTDAMQEEQASFMATGMLIKHGQVHGSQPHRLPTSAVNMIWTLRLRPGDLGAEENTKRQAEMLLRDILTAYRNLALLAKVRGLPKLGEECVPLHLLCAMRGAEALTGHV